MNERDRNIILTKLIIFLNSIFYIKKYDMVSHFSTLTAGATKIFLATNLQFTLFTVIMSSGYILVRT